MKAEPGKFLVCIRIDRANGQFVTSYTQVPADLLSRPDEQQVVTDKIANGFAAAYIRVAQLPE
jgi:hypothetical protein